MKFLEVSGLGLLFLAAGCDDLTFGSSVGGVPQNAPAVAGAVKAVGLVLQRLSPGGTRLLEAQLQLVDPGQPDRTVPVGDLRLLVGGEPLTLFSVAPNFYQSASTPDFGTLNAGTEIALSLVAALPSGAKTLTSELQIPAAPSLRLPALAEPPASGVETAIELRGAGQAAIAIVSPVSMWGTQVTYDLLTDAGANAAPSARIDRWWQAVASFQGPDETLPLKAFPESGNYWVEVIALAPESGEATTSAGWAAGTWFAAGNATGGMLEAP